MGKRKSRSLSPCHTVNKEQKLSSTTERGSSSAERPQRDYQVFLSFRGRDTRRGFTNSLYHSLVDAGVRVFVDNKALCPGDRIREILAAINRSQVCIPIFSVNYAESKWCLLELAEMVRLKKAIMPVFYDVKAEDVKLKTDLYWNQLRNFREKYEDKKVEWEKALKQVGASFDTTQLESSLTDAGQIKAWDITQYSGDGQLCKEVVKEILIKLEVKHKILDGSLVGIDHHVNAVRNLLDVRSSDVRFIVIHGMGGIGKTTLAKFIYNELRNRDGGFDCCCFLDDVRETTNRHSIVYLQNQLLRQLGRGAMKIDNNDSGINSIKDVVKNKKVLIVLDDLDQHKQIESLAGDSTWFYLGSRIITTTRNSSCVVKQVKVRDNDKICEYNVSEMSPDNALQLFSIHAFKQESPPTDYLHISKDVVTACGCLPLALEVMGSYLFHTNKELWKSHIHKIASREGIQDKLMISFEALEPRAKEIFLDIACFSFGSEREKKYATYMWEACDFRPDEGIECLASMSLVKISKDNTFGMHDLLRDLGREIVIRENLKRPERRSRLWSHDETERVLLRGKGTSEIDALRFVCTSEDELGSSNSPLNVNHVKPLQNLRFLELRWTSIEGDFNDALQDLKWFACHYSRMFDMTNLELKDLIVLDISLSKIGPNVLETIKIGKHLKILNLSSCWFGGNGCGLVFPEALGSLSSLVELDVSCSNFEGLPESIGNLKNLRVLKMVGSNIRELPSSIGDLKMLEELHAVNSELEYIPEDIGRLHQLRILDLDESKIRELPNLPSSLTHLHVSGSLLKLPNLLNLKRLKHLLLADHTCILEDDDTSLMENTGWISDCPSLESFELYFGRITCIHMETAAFPRLKKLRLFCPDIEVIEQLPLSLTKLCLGDAEVSFPTCLREMEALNFLELSNCRFVGELSLPRHLKTLRIMGCSLRQPVIDLSGLRMIQHLTIYDCKELMVVRGVENTKFLETVGVLGCKSMKEISDLSKFERLIIWSDDIGLFRGINYIITEHGRHPFWGDIFVAMTAGSDDDELFGGVEDIIITNDPSDGKDTDEE